MYYFNSSSRSSSSNSSVATIHNNKLTAKNFLLSSTHRKKNGTTSAADAWSTSKLAVHQTQLSYIASYAGNSRECISGQKASLLWTLRTTWPMFAHGAKHAHSLKEKNHDQSVYAHALYKRGFIRTTFCCESRVHPITCHDGTCRKCKRTYTICLTSELGGQRHAPAALPWEWPGTRCIRGWTSPRAGLDACGKSRLTWNRCPYRPVRSNSPNRLRYSGPPGV